MLLDKQQKQAEEALETLCIALDQRGWSYEKDEENLQIKTDVLGDDMDMALRIRVDPVNLLVSLYSELPFTVPESKRVEMAIALSMINYATVDGNFDYNFGTGRVIFRLTSRFRDSIMGVEMFDYMIGVSLGTIDAYNDKIFMVGMDRYSLEELKEFIDS